MTINKALLRNAAITGALTYVLAYGIDNKVIHSADGVFERAQSDSDAQKKLSPDRVAILTAGFNLFTKVSPIACAGLGASIVGAAFVKKEADLTITKRVDNPPFPDDDDSDTDDIDKRSHLH